MRKLSFIISILIFSVIGLSFMQVVISNSISTTGIDVEKTLNEVKSLKKQNAYLREQVLTASSLTNISSVSSAMGFIETSKHVYLAQPPLAIKQ